MCAILKIHPTPSRPALISLAIFSATFAAAAPTLTDLSAWISDATGTEIARQAILPESAAPGATLPTVIYLQNLAAPRVGRDTDEDIIDSFLAGGMLVITMDFAGHAKARVPYLNQDIVDIRADIRDGMFPTGYNLDNNHIFIVPEGCRLLRDLVFDISSPNRAMDIIYPANPLIPVGALIEFSFDNTNRMNSSNLANYHDSIISAQASEGFATAMADHPVSGGYDGIDPMPNSALSVRAAVRAIRAQSETLGLNGRIATMGFSRGSGVALMAVTTKPDQEWRVYITQTNFISFPDATLKASRDAYPDEDPSVQGAVIMSGRFTYVDLLPNDPNLNKYTTNWGSIETNYDRWEYMGAIDFLESDPGYPLFLTINKDDEHAHHQMDVLQQRLTGLEASFIFREDIDEPLAHRVTLVPSILNDMNRYLRSVLMDPSPEAAVAEMSLHTEVIDSNTVRWTSDDPLPPVDFGLEASNNLADWNPSGTIRPDAEGLLQMEVDLSAPSPQFLRVSTPPDP